MGLNREVWGAKHSQLRFPSRTEKELHITRTAGLEPINCGKTKGPVTIQVMDFSPILN